MVARALLWAVQLTLAASVNSPLLLRQGRPLASFGQIAQESTARTAAQAVAGSSSPWADADAPADDEDAEPQEEVTREDIMRDSAIVGSPTVANAAATPATFQAQQQAPMKVMAVAQATVPVQGAMSPEEAARLQAQVQQLQLEQDSRLQEMQAIQAQQQAQLVAQPPLEPLPQQLPASQTAPTRQKALVAVSAGSTAAVPAPAPAAAAASADSGPRPKGWDQCLSFARYVRSKQVTGVELVRTWKSTCEPAVRSGRASERYRLMCNSLGGAVQPYSEQVDYSVEHLCDAVLAVFHDLTAQPAAMR